MICNYLPTYLPTYIPCSQQNGEATSIRQRPRSIVSVRIRKWSRAHLRGTRGGSRVGTGTNLSPNFRLAPI
jgi:hypothetical protein